jgi:hypothetical protein
MALIYRAKTIAPALALVAAAVSLASVGCSSADAGHSTKSAEADIQGGQSWGGDYAVGMIAYRGGGVCTGTLIKSNVVLTAGHCVQGSEDEILGFYLGAGAPIVSTNGPTTEMPDNLTRYAVDKVALYPGFDLSAAQTCPIAQPDVALLHLAEPVQHVLPAEVPRPGEESSVVASDLAKSKTCWAVGYGRHDVAGVTTAKEKRVAQVIVNEVLPAAVSVVAAPNVSGGITDEGDSGGPLICVYAGIDARWKWRITGVVSCATDGVAAAHHEQYYVRTDTISEWLAAALVQFPEEETCSGNGGDLAMRCTGQDLQYCDGQRWRPMQTCSATQACDAQARRCRAL